MSDIRLLCKPVGVSGIRDVASASVVFSRVIVFNIMPKPAVCNFIDYVYEIQEGR